MAYLFLGICIGLFLATGYGALFIAYWPAAWFEQYLAYAKKDDESKYWLQAAKNEPQSKLKKIWNGSFMDWLLSWGLFLLVELSWVLQVYKYWNRLLFGGLDLIAPYFGMADPLPGVRNHLP